MKLEFLENLLEYLAPSLVKFICKISFLNLDFFEGLAGRSHPNIYTFPESLVSGLSIFIFLLGENGRQRTKKPET